MRMHDTLCSDITDNSFALASSDEGIQGGSVRSTDHEAPPPDARSVDTLRPKITGYGDSKKTIAPTISPAI
jgi:hypothetical protein